MPGKIKVKILAGRNLPVMDRFADTTDAYVEIKFGTTTYKTEVCRKSLNPQWNSEWYKFEVEDAELQDEPLQIRLMDYDTYSANDAIGKVYVNLNPLLLPGVPLPVKNIWTLEASLNSSMGSQGGSVMTGWLPVYDTMHGIRGEVNIIVKVELFLDFNKFRQSSCGVTFFYSPIVPHGYHAQVIHGFVEELVVSDDPEYKWIDKIRTPRASNEARQTLFLKLSNEVQRKIGLKALDLGGNAVIGYLQNFDLEGESGIVARGIGTVVTLMKLHDFQNFLSEAPTSEEFGSQILRSNKVQSPDCSESEDSPRSLPHQSYHHYHHHHHAIVNNNNSSGNSTINHNNSPTSSSTLISSKFPLYGDNVPVQPVTPLKVIEPRQPLGRQISVHSRTSPSSRRGLSVSGSSLSLADDVIDEASMRAMLALEDMRGEPQGNRFSRGLKNLRYLPQSVLAKRGSGFMKSKWVDSLDEESDLESTYSSTWSICGSDSTKSSSILDLRQSMRKKKFRHRKATGEGIAAMLIRSVHAGGPLLDSVKEDRETPVPSPVNFIDEESSDQRESVSSSKSQKNSDDQNLLMEIDKPELESTDNDYNDVLVGYSKLKLSTENNAIPTITSSESDTSTSEENDIDGDDDEEDPSESSTNYIILDDTLSLLDPSSSDIENCLTLGDSQIQLYPSSQPNFTSQLIKNENEETNLILEKDEETSMSSSKIFEKKEQNFLPVDDVLSSEFSSDIDSDLPLSAIPSDYRSKRTKKLSTGSKTAKLVDHEDQKNLSEPTIHNNTTTPLQSPNKYSKKRETLLPVEVGKIKCNVTPEQSPKSNNSKFLRHRLHKQISLTQMEEDYHTESSDDEYYVKKHQRSSKIQEKKLLINLHDDQHQSSSTDYPEKQSRRVERAETVIYKGLKENKEKNLLDIGNNEALSIPPPLLPTVVTPTLVSSCAAASDANRLQVPSVNLKDIVSKSPFPINEAAFSEDAYAVEMLNKKYRQSCMLDLIKVIDSKMLTHHHSHTESTRRRKHLTIVKRTPSPDSVHRKMFHYRRSRSRSPDISSVGHHHHHHAPHSSHLSLTSTHNLAKHSQKNHHSSCECITGKQYHTVGTSNSESVLDLSSEKMDERAVVSAIKTLAQIKPDNNEAIDKSELLEMHALKVLDNSAVTNAVLRDEDIAAMISSSTISNITPTTITTITNVSETKPTNMANATDNLCVSHSPSIRRQQHQQNQNQEIQQPSISPGVNQQQSKVQSPASKNSGIPLHRRSSDSDLSITPKDNIFTKKGRSFRLRSDRGYPSKSKLNDTSSGNSLTGSDRSMGGYLKPSTAVVRTMNQEALEMLEYPFITMQQYPPGFVLHIGGLVSARSVKLLERISNLEEPEGRDSWWTEIRMEIRSHARALACNVVIGYKEETSICDDVCVLSGSGTAAVINLHSTGQDQDNVLITHVQGLMTTSTESDKGTSAIVDKVQNPKSLSKDIAELPTQQQQHQQTPVAPTTMSSNHQASRSKQRLSSESNEHEPPYGFPPSGCSLCHLPYNKSSMSFQVSVSKCTICRRAKVPDILFTTVELPENLPMTGRGCLIQATVCKAKKDLRGELNAKEISDCLPFLEYELHSLLLNKLRMRGMNAAFGLKVQVSIGERLVIGMAAGTAVYLTALPPPSLPQIATGNSWHNEDQLAEIQKSLVETVKKNMEFYQLKPLPEVENGRSMSDTDESEDEMPELDLGLGMKDVCVLEVDDVEDMDRISLLMDERPPNDFHVVNTETIPGLEDLEIVRNLQMFTQVSRAKIPMGQSTSMPSKYFARVLQTVYFKLRRMVPCALCDLQFKIAMPEQDEIQLSVVGMALGLGEPTRYNKVRRRILSHSMSKDQVKRNDDTDMIFSLDEDHAESISNVDSIPNTPNTQSSTLNASISQKSRPRSPLRIKYTTHRHKHVPLKERYGVDITPLSYLPGGRIERYLGNLNFFFIRESNSIRENGGLSGFIHSFVTEVLSIVRAHITALGGNAMVAFFMTQCVLLHSPHKNQGQCLINVGGDVVNVSYFGNDKQQQTMSAIGGNC